MKKWSTPIEVVYDGDCGLCRACVAWLARRDGRQLIRATPSAACTWPDRDNVPLASTVMVRDAEGTTWQESSAVARALAALPGAWSLVGRGILVVNETPARFIADALYRGVARHRIAISAVLVRSGILAAGCALNVES
jgi:predicted DCC family thiol-disulfide oxidoreductase YuxK